MSGGPESHEGEEYISEREDTFAEDTVINLPAIQSEKQQLIDGFSKGFERSAEVEKAFIIALTRDLDDIVDACVRREVNVKDFSDISIERQKEIKENVEKNMEDFITLLEDEIGVFRDSSDVEDTRNKTRDLFKSTEVSEYTSNIEESRSSPNNADIKISHVDKSGSKIETVVFDYNDPEKGNFVMGFTSNESFFKDKSHSGPDTLAGKIKTNREAYLLPGVNYKIEDPKAFDDFIKQQLKSSKLNIASLTSKQAITAAVNIVKGNLQIDSSTTSAGPSDKIPIDQLIMGKKGGCCRHFTVATTVVFEQIQKLSEDVGNDSLKDIVMFENHMPGMEHGTVAIARGDEVTVIEPTWYAQGIPKKYKKNFDATFSGDHGVEALFYTLSKYPKGRSDLAITDLGNSDRFVRAIYKEKIDDKDSDQFADASMSVILRAQQMILSGQLSVDTPGELEATVSTLVIIVNNKFNGPLSKLDKVQYRDMKNLAEFVLEQVINKAPDTDFWKLQKFRMDNFVINPINAKLKPQTAALANGSFYMDTGLKIDALSISSKGKDKLKVEAALNIISHVGYVVGKAIRDGNWKAQNPYGMPIPDEVESIVAIKAVTDMMSFIVNNGLLDNPEVQNNLDVTRNNLKNHKGEHSSVNSMISSIEIQLSRNA